MTTKIISIADELSAERKIAALLGRVVALEDNLKRTFPELFTLVSTLGQELTELGNTLARLPDTADHARNVLLEEQQSLQQQLDEALSQLEALRMD